MKVMVRVGAQPRHENEQFPFDSDVHERWAQKNHSQTLQRLDQRGGLSWCEALAILQCREWRRMDDAEAERLVRAICAQSTKRILIDVRAVVEVPHDEDLRALAMALQDSPTLLDEYLNRNGREVIVHSAPPERTDGR